MLTRTPTPLISPHSHSHPNCPTQEPHFSLSPTPVPDRDASLCQRFTLKPHCLLQALPRALINIRTAVQTVLAGTTVELECLGLGEPRPHVTWSKVGGRIRPGVLVRAGTLTIEQVERADAGQYRCTATNAVGTVQSHVILHVQGEHGDAEVGTHTMSPQGGDTSVRLQLLLKSPGSRR